MTSAGFIRRETASDVDAIRHVHNLAFGSNADTLSCEVRLVDDLRTGTSWIPALSIVAEVTGLVVGHALRPAATSSPPAPPQPNPHSVSRPSAYSPTSSTSASAPNSSMPCSAPPRPSTKNWCASSATRPTTTGSDSYSPPASASSHPDPTWTPHFQALHLTPHPWVTTPATFRYDPAFDRQP